MNKVLGTVAVISVAGAIISGGLWMLTSQSSSLEGMSNSQTFKKATVVFGGIAILSIGIGYATHIKLAK